jgi:isoamyl acetate esterase
MHQFARKCVSAILIDVLGWSATSSYMLTQSINRPKVGRKAPPSKKLGSDRVRKLPHSKQSTRRTTRTKSTPSHSGTPSERWASYEGVNDFQAKRIKEVFRTADWEFLCSEAVDCHRRQHTVRSSRQTRGPTCKISHDRFACGASNLVLEVSFSDSTHWVVRIRFLEDARDDPDAEKAMHSEVATMRLIQERTSIPVAKIFGYNAEQGNPFGYQYMFMSVLPGRHLDGPFAMSVPVQHQQKVANQLAEILHQLSTRMIFERIGRVWCGEHGEEEPSIISFNACGASEGHLGKYPIGPFSTSLEYFYILRQHENDAVCAAKAQGIIVHEDETIWPAACRVFGHALCSLVCREMMTGPFPMKNVDLHYNNILLDENFNITGILDFSGAQTVPCESFAVCTEFIIPPNAPKEVAAKMSAFRDMVRMAWKKRESNREFKWSSSDVVGSSMGDLIYYSYTLGALRRSVAYAQIVGSLLYGHGFSLNNLSYPGLCGVG